MGMTSTNNGDYQSWTISPRSWKLSGEKPCKQHPQHNKLTSCDIAPCNKGIRISFKQKNRKRIGHTPPSSMARELTGYCWDGCLCVVKKNRTKIHLKHSFPRKYRQNMSWNWKVMGFQTQQMPVSIWQSPRLTGHWGRKPWHGEVMLPNASNDHVSPGVRWESENSSNQGVSWETTRVSNETPLNLRTLNRVDVSMIQHWHWQMADSNVSLEIWQSGTGQGWQFISVFRSS